MTMLYFSCPECGHRMACKESHAMKTAVCKQCSYAFVAASGDDLKYHDGVVDPIQKRKPNPKPKRQAPPPRKPAPTPTVEIIPPPPAKEPIVQIIKEREIIRDTGFTMPPPPRQSSPLGLISAIVFCVGAFWVYQNKENLPIPRLVITEYDQTNEVKLNDSPEWSKKTIDQKTLKIKPQKIIQPVVQTNPIIKPQPRPKLQPKPKPKVIRVKMRSGEERIIKPLRKFTPQWKHKEFAKLDAQNMVKKNGDPSKYQFYYDQSIKRQAWENDCHRYAMEKIAESEDEHYRISRRQLPKKEKNWIYTSCYQDRYNELLYLEDLKKEEHAKNKQQSIKKVRKEISQNKKPMTFEQEAADYAKRMVGIDSAYASKVAKKPLTQKQIDELYIKYYETKLSELRETRTR